MAVVEQFNYLLLLIIFQMVNQRFSVQCQEVIAAVEYTYETDAEFLEIIPYPSHAYPFPPATSSYQFNLSTLIYTTIITRHGSRSPMSTYPTDPYPYINRKYWPAGVGELTRFGKQQLYESGRILRKRYDGFLSEEYINNEITVRTNKFNRDFMSAACLLAGLFPPVGYQVWNPYILWQPIPIWVEPFDAAKFKSTGPLCPKYRLLQEKAVSKLDSSQYKQLLEYVRVHSGEKTMSIKKIGKLMDAFIMQYENGYKLPEWVKPIFPEPLNKLHILVFDTSVASSTEMIRLSVGPILDNLRQQFLNKASGNIPDNKMYLLAAHDITVFPILRALGFKMPLGIMTSAFIIFELHQIKTGEKFVQVVYYNSSATPIPNILNPPICPSPCPLKNFVKSLETFIPEDLIEECKLSDKDDE